MFPTHSRHDRKQTSTKITKETHVDKVYSVQSIREDKIQKKNNKVIDNEVMRAVEAGFEVAQSITSDLIQST
jgi:2-oxoglutarate dehydrogenase complex dehydrogenase (E1) component-like enzyme